MAPPATPRFQAPIQRREEVPQPRRPVPVEEVPVLPAEVELVGAVEPRRDAAHGWNPAPLLDALVEMHNPEMENP